VLECEDFVSTDVLASAAPHDRDLHNQSAITEGLISATRRVSCNVLALFDKGANLTVVALKGVAADMFKGRPLSCRC
jgi:hypothetical protein